jgi:translation initiation factor 4G
MLPLLLRNQPVLPRGALLSFRRKQYLFLRSISGIRILDEAQQCIEELQSPGYYPEIVKEAVNPALDKGTNFVDPLVRLLEHLYT